MKRVLLLLLALLLVPALASAQTVTSYTVVITNTATSAVVSTTVIPAASFVCNQTPVTGTGTVNDPRHIQFADPVNAGMACIYTDTGPGPLASLPFTSAVYSATLAASNSTATSLASTASNLFMEAGAPPPVPTGVKVTP